MAVICPTIDAFNNHQYRSQIERVEPFAKRIHIDLMDGIFAPHKSPPPKEIWWPDHLMADIHLMYQEPMPELKQLVKLKPNLVIIHFESAVDHCHFAVLLKEKGIKAGLAILQKTPVEEVKELLPSFDHVMVYSGSLGTFGGMADLALLDKVKAIRQQFPDIEISWDGGVNSQNAKQLVEAGVDVLNVGGFIQKAEDPHQQYERLSQVITY